MDRALIGMSGGVDSSVAAYLTQKEGFDCIGATMGLYVPLHCGGISRDARDAESVCQKMGIPHYIFDYSDAFREKVMEPFVRVYEEGGTPNPCILCNRHLKFGAMLLRARELGCKYVVTGHYARVRQDEATGRYLLYRSADREKDQSYFLYALTQDQLSSIRFPLGELSKAQVREIAQAQGFITAAKHDSQDICFVPDGDYFAFLQHFTGKTYGEGPFLDTAGEVVGTHHGAVGYTLGQRKGLGVAMGRPVYVCAKDMDANTVTLGDSGDLMSRGLLANDWFWFPFPELREPLAATAKTRYSRGESSARVYPQGNGFARVEFDTPQRAITPGQAVVLYCGDMVLGGGTIIRTLP